MSALFCLISLYCCSKVLGCSTTGFTFSGVLVLAGTLRYTFSIVTDGGGGGGAAGGGALLLHTLG